MLFRISQTWAKSDFGKEQYISLALRIPKANICQIRQRNGWRQKIQDCPLLKGGMEKWKKLITMWFGI